jgi:hypothetical protein
MQHQEFPEVFEGNYSSFTDCAWFIAGLMFANLLRLHALKFFKASILRLASDPRAASSLMIKRTT